MNKLLLDTEVALCCQVCKEDIEPQSDKIVIGNRPGPRQGIFVFHPDCWRVWKLTGGTLSH